MNYTLYSTPVYLSAYHYVCKIFVLCFFLHVIFIFVKFDGDWFWEWSRAATTTSFMFYSYIDKY